MMVYLVTARPIVWVISSPLSCAKKPCLKRVRVTSPHVKPTTAAVAGLGLGDPALATAFAASNIDNTGSGEVKQSNTLGGDISATVVRALTNGNLIIRGEKMIALNDGNEFIQISGMIRSEDVQPDNTVLSKRIANAEISYSGDGDYVDATKAGWGTKLFYKIWPF